MVAVVLAALAASASTFTGGLLAMRVTRWLGATIALGAGVRIGAAFFDLIPEATELLDSLDLAMLGAAAGFIIFYVVERVTVLHLGHEAEAELEGHQHQHVGIVGAGGMSAHSFLDGLAVGAALQVGLDIGAIIALVVVLHGFSDGVSTVGMLRAHGVSARTTWRWLLVDAAAPAAGALVGLVVGLPEPVLGLLLASFAGFFLYVGAVELLPQAHRHDRSPWVMFGTLAGVALILAAGALAVHL